MGGKLCGVLVGIGMMNPRLFFVSSKLTWDGFGLVEVVVFPWLFIASSGIRVVQSCLFVPCKL